MSTAQLSITETDHTMLLALSRFHYLTAAQASRLLYPALCDDNRYMQRRFNNLVDRQYVLRLRRLPTPRYGQAPHVFTLDQRGRRYLQGVGAPVPAYFRPSEEHQAAWNDPFMTHRLAAIDVLIAAAMLCRDYEVSCPRLLPERTLRHHPIRVRIASGSGGRLVAVIPDGWFQLRALSGALPTPSLWKLTEGQRIKRPGAARWPGTPHGRPARTGKRFRPTTSPSPLWRRLGSGATSFAVGPLRSCKTRTRLTS